MGIKQEEGTICDGKLDFSKNIPVAWKPKCLTHLPADCKFKISSM